MLRSWRRLEKTALLLILLLAALAVMTALKYYYPADPQAIYFIPGNRSRVALTFETLWSSSGLDQTLAILERESVRATFFISGTWLKQNPDAAREILKRGHEIGNHTLSQKNLLYLNEKEMAEEIRGFNELALEILEYRPRLFRPPLGLYNGLVLEQARRNRLQTILWTVESYDSISGGDEIVDRVTSRMRGGAIISFRVGEPALQEALPVIIAYLRENGYEPVPVSLLLRAP